MSTKKQREAWKKANAKYRKTEKGKAAALRANRKRRKNPVYNAKVKVWQEEWREQNPDKVKAQRLRCSLKVHHLTPDIYFKRLEEQGNVCALCHLAFTENNGPAIDHDHRCCDSGSKSCGKCFCGIIHQKCNRGIGQLDDDPKRARLAYEYLLRTRS